eukprot:PITA_27698
MNWKVLMNGIWEMAKDALCQKLFASHLPSNIPLPNLKYVSCVVTGATSGIGLHTARELAMAGAHVIMACRNTKLASELAQEWQRQQKQANRDPLSIEVMELELMSLSSVRSFAANLVSRQAPLRILINNAGIYRMGEPQQFSRDGNEQHMQVNHLGPALLTILLLPLLLKAGGASRIVNVNSVAHHCGVVDPQDLNLKLKKNSFNCISAYGASKLAHLMFLSVLSSRLPANAEIDVIAVHPGIVSTNLLGVIATHYSNKSFWRFDPAEGARSVLFCATTANVPRNDPNENHRIGGEDNRDTSTKFAYYRYDCKPAKICRRANDWTVALQVWDKTLGLLDVSPDTIDIADFCHQSTTLLDSDFSREHSMCR